MEDIKVVLEEGGCTCGVNIQEPHTCPLKTEILDDYISLCNCCDYCKKQCSYEV